MESAIASDIDHNRASSEDVGTKKTEPNRLKKVNWNLILVLLWASLIIVNFSRLFYNNFWVDECYTILTAQKPLDEIMNLTKYADANPPLYYILVKLFCEILGYNTFVYCFVSFIPYLILMILSLTFIRKNFGIDSAAVVMLFASILEQSQYYITEVRAYNWALFFLFIMFLVCYKILKESDIKYYVLITVVYICACYTHYYALMGGGLVLLGMIIRSAIVKDKRNFWLSSASLLISFIAFTPWLQFFMKESSDITNPDFWIQSTPLITECIVYMFGYNPSVIIFLVLVGVTVIVLLGKIGVLKKTGKIEQLFDMDNDKWSIVSIGLFAIFGVTIFTAAVSHLKSPILALRYVFPLAGIAWTIVAIFVSGCRFRKKFMVVVLLFTLVIGIPHCCIWMSGEYQENVVITETLDSTRPLMAGDVVILTNESRFIGYECTYYYPDAENYYLRSDEFPTLIPTKQYWLFLASEIDNGMIEKLSEQGHSYELIKPNGRLGSDPMWVYLVN